MNTTLQKQNRTNSTPQHQPEAHSKAIRTVRPRYGVREDAESFFIDIEVPGVKREHISLSLEKGQLELNAHRDTGVPSDWKVIRRETADFDYRLSLTLNVDVQEDAISANLDHGILSLQLPKAECVKARKIEIN